MIVCFVLRQNIEVIPLDVMSSGFDVVSNGFPIMKPWFSFTNLTSITAIPVILLLFAIVFVHLIPCHNLPSAVIFEHSFSKTATHKA